jgi:hypothetical protein
MVSKLLKILALALAVTCPGHHGFTTMTNYNNRQPLQRLTRTTCHAQSPEESAAMLTEFMAKAHEEKIRAMAGVESKYGDQIAELQAKIQELEKTNGSSPVPVVPTGPNSYALPATNKAMSESIQAYRTFLSDYIVHSQTQKMEAIARAEKKLAEKYEARIEGMKN